VRLVEATYSSCFKDIELLIFLDVIVALDLTWSVLRLSRCCVMLYDVSIILLWNWNSLVN